MCQLIYEKGTDIIAEERRVHTHYMEPEEASDKEHTSDPIEWQLRPYTAKVSFLMRRLKFGRKECLTRRCDISLSSTRLSVAGIGRWLYSFNIAQNGN